MTIEIRPLAERDQPAWLPLWHRYLAYHGSRPEDVTETTWARLMDPAEPMHGIGAFVEGTLVGAAQFVFHRHTWWTDNLCLLVDVFTSERVRRRGIGTALVEGVFDRARAAGSRCVWGITITDNVAARSIYDRVANRLDQAVYSKSL